MTTRALDDGCVRVAGARRPVMHVARRILAGVALVAACIPVAWHLRTIIAVIRARLTFPGELEWVEGNMLYHAHRLIHGEYLYGDPARGFATLPYPPLYWAIVGIVGRVFGLDYAAGRAVSVVCIGGAACILVGAVVRSAPRRRVGFLLGALALAGIAAGFPGTGGSYDIARVDSLAIFAPVLAAAVAGDGRVSFRRGALLAVLLTATLYAKQTGVFFVVWLIGFVVARDRRGGAFVAAATFASSGALLAVLCWLTNGWFWVWLFSAGHHALHGAMWADAVGRILTNAPFLLLLPSLILELVRRRWLRPATAKWTGMLVAGLVASLVPAIKAGGWYNVLMPSSVLAWPVAFLLVGDLLCGLRSPRAQMRAQWGALASGAVLLALLEYEPTQFVPSPKRKQEAAQLDALLRDLDGEAVVPTNAFAAVRAGKVTTQPILLAHLEANILGVGVTYADALANSEATWIVLTGRPIEASLPQSIEARFVRVKELDFGFGSLAEWDTAAAPMTLWKRR